MSGRYRRFLVAPDGAWWFLEMNTRLQVEHPVTEAKPGSIGREQIRIARGERIGAQADPPAISGHAVEARLLAEDPATGDLPQSGVLHRFEVPGVDGVRVDAGVDSGSVIGAHYDPLLAKVIAHRGSRGDAVGLLAATLARPKAHGVATNRTSSSECFATPTSWAARSTRPGSTGSGATSGSRCGHRGRSVRQRRLRC